MSKVRTKISVSGFNDDEINEGINDFRSEFIERTWLKNVQVSWDNAEQLLIVTAETEGVDPQNEAQGVIDEIWDCVIAYFSFSSEKISFKILQAEFIE